MRQKIKNIKLNWIVIILLLLGVFYKLYVTADQNILFHIDSARDYVDVREMVELLKPRLIGQTSAIEGFYTGPGWYYLLAIPYVLFGGDPYGGVVLMIALWAVGGYFLYLVTRKYGLLGWFIPLIIWFASPYIQLTTVYSFNPHPILYLTPLFVYLLEKYLITEKMWYGIGAAFLAAQFFQWEMNTGVFMPIIILLMVFFAGKTVLFKTRGFWLSVGVFSLTFIPQLLFDLKHNFLMSNAVIRFMGTGGAGQTFAEKTDYLWDVFYGAFTPTLLNSQMLVNAVLIVFLIVAMVAVLTKRSLLIKKPDLTLFISLLIIVVPYIGYLLLPVLVHSWHMVSIVAALIISVGFLVSALKSSFPIGWGLIAFMLLFCLVTTWDGVSSGFKNKSIPSDDPSTLRNELYAIDFVYQQAGGNNFKAYSYLPSIIDFPYQYLYWWYGLKKYGYTPQEYVYLPNMPQYISNKDLFTKPKVGAPDSQLIMLIKEGDRIKMRHLWEGNFQKYPLINEKKVGPLEIEVRMATDSGMINPAL